MRLLQLLGERFCGFVGKIDVGDLGRLANAQRVDEDLDLFGVLQFGVAEDDQQKRVGRNVRPPVDAYRGLVFATDDAQRNRPVQRVVELLAWRIVQRQLGGDVDLWHGVVLRGVDAEPLRPGLATVVGRWLGVGVAATDLAADGAVDQMLPNLSLEVGRGVLLAGGTQRLCRRTDGRHVEALKQDLPIAKHGAAARVWHVSEPFKFEGFYLGPKVRTSCQPPWLYAREARKKRPEPIRVGSSGQSIWPFAFSARLRARTILQPVVLIWGEGVSSSRIGPGYGWWRLVVALRVKFGGDRHRDGWHGVVEGSANDPAHHSVGVGHDQVALQRNETGIIDLDDLGDLSIIDRRDSENYFHACSLPLRELGVRKSLCSIRKREGCSARGRLGGLWDRCANRNCFLGKCNRVELAVRDAGGAALQVLAEQRTQSGHRVIFGRAVKGIRGGADRGGVETSQKNLPVPVHGDAYRFGHDASFPDRLRLSSVATCSMLPALIGVVWIWVTTVEFWGRGGVHERS